MLEPQQQEQEQEQETPWGCFKLVSKDPAEESDHMYFTRKVHKIGRNPQRCDILIDELFISSVHCIIRLEEEDTVGKLVVKLTDKSRNGVWVNEDRVGKGNTASLESSFTIHFTKPGLKASGVLPKVYKFELLTNEMNWQSEVRGVVMDDKPSTLFGGGDASPEPTQQSASVEEEASPTAKKRKRVSQDNHLGVGQGTQVLEDKGETAEVHAAELQTEAASTMTAAKTLVEQSNAAMEKVQAENRELKVKLARKDKDIAVKLSKAAEESKRSLESELLAKTKEMNAKVDEAVNQTQKKLEAEHFEQRREMSEKMAAFANEGEKLQQQLGLKQAELAEWEEKLVDTEEKLIESKEENTELIALLAQAEEKIDKAEQKAFVAEQKVTEAEEKVAAAEEKAAVADQKADIIVKSVGDGTSESSSKEREKLEESLASLKTELKEIRTWNRSLAEEVKKQRKVGATSAPSKLAPPLPTASELSCAAKSGPPSDDTEDVMRLRLTAAANLFKAIQDLGASGVNSIADANPLGLGDLHLLSNASVQSMQEQSHADTAGSGGSAAVSSSAVDTVSEATSNAVVDGQDARVKAVPDDEDPPAEENDKEAMESEQDVVPAQEATDEKADVVMAEPKAEVHENTARNPKKTKKEAAPLSAVIETDAASAIVAMASTNDREEKPLPSEAKHSSSEDSNGHHNAGSKSTSDNDDEASGEAENGGEGDRDWEMLE